MESLTSRVDTTPIGASDRERFWRTADRKVLQQLLSSKQRTASQVAYSGEYSPGKTLIAEDDVFGYMAGAVDFALLPPRVAIGVSSRGNFFMAEIARVLEDAFKQLGTQVRLFNESEVPAVSDTDPVLIVAPHEFFPLGDGHNSLKAFARASSLIMLNTEQPQTPWFAVAERYLRRASVVLDINFESARHLRASGYQAFVLPLGYSDYIARTFDGRVLPEHELFKHMCDQGLTPPSASYADRPIDILFVGTASPRRRNFFARAAGFLASTNSFIYMPDGDIPFSVGSPRTIDTAAFVALARRSKVLLNIHRDDVPYLEWQRIVTFGIMQKTLAVTDHCNPGPCLEANLDYLDGPLEDVPRICELALGNCDIAEAVAESAYARLKNNYPMEQILGRCFTALAKPACRASK